MTLPWNSCRFDQAAAHTVGTSAFPCIGTAIHVTSPNDLGNAAWTKVNAGSVGSQIDPLGGNNASSLVAVSSQTGFNVQCLQDLGTLTGGVTYAFTSYFKPVSGSTWVLFGVTDNTASSFAKFFNLSGAGSVGSANASGGTGSISCAQIITDAGGYYRLSFAGAFSVTNVLAKIGIYLVNGDGDGSTTIGQEIYSYQVSP